MADSNDIGRDGMTPGAPGSQDGPAASGPADGPDVPGSQDGPGTSGQADGPGIPGSQDGPGASGPADGPGMPGSPDSPESRDQEARDEGFGLDSAVPKSQEARAQPKAKAPAVPKAVQAGPKPGKPPRPVALRTTQDAKGAPRPRPAREDRGEEPEGELRELRQDQDGQPLATLKASPRVRVSLSRSPEPISSPKSAAARTDVLDGPSPVPLPPQPVKVPRPPRRAGTGGEASGAASVAVSARARGVTPFMVMEVLERARELEAQGRTVVHMEVGEPDFPTPDFVVEAMRRALDTGESFGYAHSLGDPELREALSRHYLRRYGIAVGPERFLVCPGTSAGMALLFGAVLEPGDKVVLSDPCYSCYPNFVRFCGGVPVFQKVHERDGFRFDPDALKGLLKRERGVKAVMVNSPANPTGAVLDPERMKAIAELGPFVISDEIYHGLNYLEERDHSFLEYTDRCAVVGGLSKSWAMTGWRVGHLALPPDLARPLQTLAQNFVISVNSAVQKAAAVALDEGWPEVERMRSVYDSRRKLLLDGLRRLGLVVMAEPAGAFYILARADHVNPDSRALVFEILEEAGVGCVPGREFGAGAEGFLRFSYAVSSEGIEEALRRLEGFLAARGKLPS